MIILAIGAPAIGSQRRAEDQLERDDRTGLDNLTQIVFIACLK